MSKKAISVTLSPENLLWLRAQTTAGGNRSVSETLDRLLHEARSGKQRPVGHRSAVGMVRISAGDPELEEADAAIQDLFSRSFERIPKPRELRRTKRRKH